MTFRTRLTILFLLAVLVPMVALTAFIRGEMTERLTHQYQNRVESLISVIEEDLAQQSSSVSKSLAQICEATVNDNKFRRAVVDRALEERRYLLDYAGNAMRLTGLSMLQIQDRKGRIISSGHFRNEYDRIEPDLPRLLASSDEKITLVKTRAPDSPFLAMARMDSFSMSGEQFSVIGGVRIGASFLSSLARDRELNVTLTYPGGRIVSGSKESLRKKTESISDEEQSSNFRHYTNSNRSADSDHSTKSKRSVKPGQSNALVRKLDIAFIDLDAGKISQATFRVSHNITALHSLLNGIDRWFLIVTIVGSISAIALVSWLASRISRPLEELAGKTSQIDLDNLDVDFTIHRKDEIGKLSRVLNTMTERLRLSTARIKNAERRATLGEMARQVNHDIKNGLAPLRNIFRHLAQLAQKDAAELMEVFRERQVTFESSISYLEELASKYAGITPRIERRKFNINGVIRRSLGDLPSADSVKLNMSLCDGAVVAGDPLSLQRVMENLIRNARDSLESKPGEINIDTSLAKDSAGRKTVRITVTDTGTGISEEQKSKIFDHFYTTREKGTGLGLSIVQRLVRDLGGSLSVESELGKGTSFIIDLPLDQGG
jgi:signal transduction histidine kinase